MAHAARVTSIDALKDFKRALQQFVTLATTALGEAHADVQRTTWWVTGDQQTYWKAQKRKWTARLAEAKNELFRAELAAQDGSQVHATLERRRVEKARQALEEADRKLANIRKWTRLLERETVLYKGECQSLARALEGELPEALGRLDQMIEALQRYVKLPVPETAEEADEPPDPGGKGGDPSS